VTGYVVVVEGDEEQGFSCYAPELPGVVAAAAGREDAIELMGSAIAEHITILRAQGVAVPEPTSDATVMIVAPAA
jgi:predicted RNase H-like HicB family nuclease